MIDEYSWQNNKKTKNKIAELICQNKIIPIIGSGFTRNCEAKNGVVPSGKEMSDYLINFAAKTYHKDIKYYENTDFETLCTYYSKRSDHKERFDYFSSNFTNVIIEKFKIEFLRLFKNYIYTLNIDDAIEYNCNEYHVVLPRCNFYDEYINQYQTVFKIHGDVHNYLKNMDTEGIIFNKRQYIDSIKSNKKMLLKFKQDFSENNLLYIGCSLTDEPDLLSVISEAIKDKRNECKVYYITGDQLEEDKKDLLEDYGITTCIQVKNYNDFYIDIVELCSNNIEESTVIDNFKEPNIDNLSKKNTNIQYLINSNLVISYPYCDSIIKPYFFINRDICDDIINDLKVVSPVHIIYGHRVSGKTMCLLDIYDRLMDRKRYFFPSNTKITDAELDQLLQKSDSVFIFDTNCLNTKQIYKVATLRKKYRENNNYVVIAVNTSDRNGLDLINPNRFYCATLIKNIFSISEIDRINKKLQSNNLPTMVRTENKRKSYGAYYSIGYTLLDNLCIIADKFSPNSSDEFPNISRYSSDKQLSLLILLATERTLSSYELFYFNLNEEANLFAKRFSKYFEFTYNSSNVSRSDSREKLITNSRYYLIKHLSEYANNEDNYKSILQAYKYIYDKIYNMEDEFNIPRKMLDYIKFDVLNDIFYRKNSSLISLIKYIYEGMEDVMNVNPQFKHQRAKSIFWLCENSLSDIRTAARYVALARFDIENILKNRDNANLKISLEHIKYTQASIGGRLCYLEDYRNQDSVIKSLGFYIEALSSDENRCELSEIIDKKAEKHIYSDLYELIKFINQNMTSNTQVLQDANSLAELINMDTSN